MLSVLAFSFHPPKVRTFEPICNFFTLIFHIQLLPHTKTTDLRGEKWAKMPGVMIPSYPKHGFMIKYCLRGKNWKEGAIHAIEGVRHTIRHVWWHSLLILNMTACHSTPETPGPRWALRGKFTYIIAIICFSFCHVPDTTLGIWHIFSQQILTTTLWNWLH